MKQVLSIYFLSSWTRTRTHTRRTSTTMCFGFRFVAFAKRVEAIGEGEHEITGECVELNVFRVVCSNSTVYAVLLLEEVVCFHCYSGSISREELVRDRSVPHPGFGVVACGVTACGSVSKVCVENNAERSVVCSVKHAAIIVYGGTLCR